MAGDEVGQMANKINKTPKGAKMVKPNEDIFEDISDEMADELAYDAAIFEAAMKDMMDDPDFEPSTEREGIGW